MNEASFKQRDDDGNGNHLVLDETMAVTYMEDQQRDDYKAGQAKKARRPLLTIWEVQSPMMALLLGLQVL